MTDEDVLGRRRNNTLHPSLTVRVLLRGALSTLRTPSNSGEELVVAETCAAAGGSSRRKFLVAVLIPFVLFRLVPPSPRQVSSRI